MRRPAEPSGCPDLHEYSQRTKMGAGWRRSLIITFILTTRPQHCEAILKTQILLQLLIETSGVVRSYQCAAAGGADTESGCQNSCCSAGRGASPSGRACRLHAQVDCNARLAAVCQTCAFGLATPLSPRSRMREMRQPCVGEVHAHDHENTSPALAASCLTASCRTAEMHSL